MADDDDKPKRKKIPLWVIVLVSSQLLIFGVGGTVFYFVNESIEEEKALLQRKKEREEFLKNRKPEPVAFETFRTNIRESKSGFRFFELKLEIMVLPGIPMQEVKAKRALIREEINFFLSTKTELDLTQEEAQEKLKDELMTRINSLLVKGRIDGLLFSQFLLE